MPTEPVRQWRVHIGAHKTATTHFQDSLYALRDQLLARGVDYLPREYARPTLQALMRRRNWRSHVGGPLMARHMTEALAPLRQGPGEVVLSDENLIGFCGDALSARPWRRLERAARAVSSLKGGAEVELAFSIRNFAQVLPGCYAEALRYRASAREPFAAFCASLTSNPPRWRDIVQRVRRAAPNVRLLIWSQPYYRDNSGSVLRRFLGPAAAGLEAPTLPRPPRTMTPSAEAVQLVEEAMTEPLPKNWARFVDRTFAAHPASDDAPKFAPLSPEQQDHLTESYAADLRWLRQNFATSFMG